MCIRDRAEGTQQNGFASTGFSGNAREAGRKADVELVNQDIVADGELMQHVSR